MRYTLPLQQLVMNFGILSIFLVSFAKLIVSCSTDANNEIMKPQANLNGLDHSLLLNIGTFLHCPQTELRLVTKNMNKLFMNDFPLEKFLSFRFDIPGLFEKNLRSRYLFLASKLNIRVDDSIPQNVAGLVKMIHDRGINDKIGLEFVTELFNVIEKSFGDRTEEFRAFLNVPCKVNSENQSQGPLSAYIILAGDRYNHDSNLLTRIMRITKLFDTGTSLPYFNKIVTELAKLDIATCLELIRSYTLSFKFSFWAAISKNDLEGIFLQQIFEANHSPLIKLYRDSCIFDVDETLLTLEQKNQVWERNNNLISSFLCESSAEYMDLIKFLNNWKYRPDLVTEAQISTCLDLPSNLGLSLQLARTIIRKQKFNLLLQFFE